MGETPALSLTDPATVPTQYWHRLADGRLQCDVCPRSCRLHEGQRGLCFIRGRVGDQVVLASYGRSSGFCLDPVEKKPLYHFLPGAAVLSFGTAGCNLTCRFCQNWDISTARQDDVLADSAAPEQIAAVAVRTGAQAVAFTYNDPVVFLEYASDTAAACRAHGVGTIAVTAGYVREQPRRELFAHLDAANIDLKAFRDDFYWRMCSARLGPVLETLEYVRHETAVWLEVTTLLIPGANDSDAELDELTRWFAEHLGVDVPLHFTAFHPDFRLQDRPPTPAATLRRARHIAQANGLHFVYTGNVHDRAGSTTSCPACGTDVVVRDRYELRHYRLTEDGRCRTCGTALPGHFCGGPGAWGAQRVPVTIGRT